MVPKVFSIATSAQVEQEELRALAGDCELGLVLDRRAVALLQPVTVHLQLALGDVQPRGPAGGESVAHVLAVLEHARIRVDVLTDRDGAVPPVAGADQAQLSAPRFGWKRLLLVRRRDPPDFRHDPDPVSYTHLRAHETPEHLVCRL